MLPETDALIVPDHTPASSFGLAMRVLPAPRRAAMFGIYAYAPSR